MLVVGKTLSALKPLPYTYVRCVDNPMKERFTKGQWYQVLVNYKVRDDKGEVGHSLAKFEPMPENYLNAFK